MIRFWVDGAPKPQARPRAFKTKEGKVRAYNPSTAEGWKSAIAQAAKEWLPPAPIEDAVELWIEFYLPRPQSLYRQKDPEEAIVCPKRPDSDNLEKAVMDALKDIGVWRDDAQVVHKDTWKMYHGKSGKPGAWITIMEI